MRRYAEKRGLDVVLGHPTHIGESVAAGLIGIEDEVVALGFPGSIWEPIEGFALLSSLTAEITSCSVSSISRLETAKTVPVALARRGEAAIVSQWRRADGQRRRRRRTR